jgi:hypothetical protein
MVPMGNLAGSTTVRRSRAVAYRVTTVIIAGDGARALEPSR